jgi:UDP-N-acetylglucosamine 2-epimerase (non-hydrolysing)
VIDACMEYLPLAERMSNILKRIKFDEFALATAHRAENVDNSQVLGNLVKIFTSCPVPVVYPVHPRTVKRLKENGLYEKLASSENVQLLDPASYFDFLVLMKQCSFIMTDSGGIQEEATSPNIRKKVFILRENTERPEAEDAGYAEVVGTKSNMVLDTISRFSHNYDLSKKLCPFGDGKAGKKILQCIDKD